MALNLRTAKAFIDKILQPKEHVPRSGRGVAALARRVVGQCPPENLLLPVRSWPGLYPEREKTQKKKTKNRTDRPPPESVRSGATAPTISCTSR